MSGSAWALGQAGPPTQAVAGRAASPRPGPALALGWSVHRPSEGSGPQPPAPVLGGGAQDRRASHLRGRRTTAQRRRAVTIKLYTSLTAKHYLRGRNLCLTGKARAGTAGRRSCRACALEFARLAPVGDGRAPVLAVTSSAAPVRAPDCTECRRTHAQLPDAIRKKLTVVSHRLTESRPIAKGLSQEVLTLAAIVRSHCW